MNRRITLNNHKNEKMKRSVLVLLMAFVLLIGGMTIASGQEQPAPKKDTVNMDTHAKPEFYYEIEDEESMNNEKKGNSTVIIIAVAVVVIGGIVVMLMKKKK